MRKIIERKIRQDKYRIRERTGKLGITLASLCEAANAKTGYKLQPSHFGKAISGKYSRPSADRTLEVADQILRDIENKIKEDKQ